MPGGTWRGPISGCPGAIGVPVPGCTGAGAGRGIVGPVPEPGAPGPELDPGPVVCASVAPASSRLTPVSASPVSVLRTIVVPPRNVVQPRIKDSNACATGWELYGSPIREDRPCHGVACGTCCPSPQAAASSTMGPIPTQPGVATPVERARGLRQNA